MTVADGITRLSYLNCGLRIEKSGPDLPPCRLLFIVVCYIGENAFLWIQAFDLHLRRVLRLSPERIYRRPARLRSLPSGPAIRTRNSTAMFPSIPATSTAALTPMTPAARPAAISSRPISRFGATSRSPISFPGHRNFPCASICSPAHPSPGAFLGYRLLQRPAGVLRHISARSGRYFD